MDEKNTQHNDLHVSLAGAMMEYCREPNKTCERPSSTCVCHMARRKERKQITSRREHIFENSTPSSPKGERDLTSTRRSSIVPYNTRRVQRCVVHASHIPTHGPHNASNRAHHVELGERTAAIPRSSVLRSRHFRVDAGTKFVFKQTSNERTVV